MSESTMESLDSILEQALSSSSARSPNDALVVALHACLLAGGFVCTAVGDEGFGDESARSLPPISSASAPALPGLWNKAQDVYALQYRHEKSRQVCLVKALPLGDQLLVNALAATDGDVVHSVTIEVSRFISAPSSVDFSSTSAFKNTLQLITTLNADITSKLAGSCAVPPKESQPEYTRGDRARSRDDWGDPLRVPPSRPVVDPDPLAERGPFGIGDGDRLPFGVGGGGGMMFDPLRQGGGIGGRFPGSMGPNLPGHPPGARFDPVGPGFRQSRRPGPHPGRGGGGGMYDPDPDHMPPPGYDDMFS